MSEDEIKTTGETIPVGPSSWAESLPALLLLVEKGDPKGQDYAKGELARMARTADLCLEYHEAARDVIDAGFTRGMSEDTFTKRVKAQVRLKTAFDKVKE